MEFAKYKMTRKQKKIILFSAILFFMIFFIIFVSFISPEELVNKIGVNNSYLFMLLISFFAGFSVWTSFSMVAILITLVAGGLNPIYLGLVSGLGLAVGDIIMFILASKGRELVSGKWEKRLNKLSEFFKGKPRKLIPFISYIYIGLTPIPNDYLMIFLALIKYPIKKLYVPLILGDITYPLIIAILASKGLTVFW